MQQGIASKWWCRNSNQATTPRPLVEPNYRSQCPTPQSPSFNKKSILQTSNSSNRQILLKIIVAPVGSNLTPFQIKMKKGLEKSYNHQSNRKTISRPISQKLVKTLLSTRQHNLLTKKVLLLTNKTAKSDNKLDALVRPARSNKMTKKANLLHASSNRIWTILPSQGAISYKEIIRLRI